MQIEYEATFTNINKDEMRERLKKSGARLATPESIRKRVNFGFPPGVSIPGGWLRLLDEDGKITLTLKIIDGNKIEDQKETIIEVDDFAETESLLSLIGCKKKAFQQSKREGWILDGVEVDIDEWPYLEPFVEIEGKSEDEVRKVSEKLGFDYSKAIFCCVTTLYSQKYSIPEKVINFDIPLITFENPNPFEKYAQ